MKNQYTVIVVGMSSRADWEQGIVNKRLKTIQPGVVNRNFHVVQTLLRRDDIYQVITVDFLPFTWRKRLKEILQAKLWRSIPGTRAWGVGWRVDQVKEKWLTLACISQRHVKKLTPFISGDSPILLWSYHPFFPEVFSMFPGATSIFDTVDDWSTHPAYAAYANTLKAHYQSISTRADIIFTVSPILKHTFPHHPKTVWIPNGVDIMHFSSPSNMDQFAHIPAQSVVYSGVIQERFDIQLMKATAEQLPDIQFILAGPVWPEVDISPLAAVPNIRFIGPIPYADLPNLFAHVRAGIIPHVINAFTQSMNPLKLYEYLAAGLPVVSTPVSGTEQFPNGVFLANTAQEWVKNIRKACALTEEERVALQHSVKDHSWDQRVDRMMRLIEEIRHEHEAGVA